MDTNKIYGMIDILREREDTQRHSKAWNVDARDKHRTISRNETCTVLINIISKASTAYSHLKSTTAGGAIAV
jgi:hypothetical protein